MLLSICFFLCVIDFSFVVVLVSLALITDAQDNTSRTLLRCVPSKPSNVGSVYKTVYGHVEEM